VRALPDDGNRYETVHGELRVTPASRGEHQYVITRLIVNLDKYLSRYAFGQVLLSPADISWARDVLVQPDVFVAAIDEARTFDWKRMRTLLLTVEVLGQTTAPYDRFTKRRVYQEFGVSSYWIVDIEARAVEIWTPDAIAPAIEREQIVWHPHGAAEPLVIRLEDLLPPR